MGCFPSKEKVYHSDAYAALQNQVRQLQQQLNVAYQGTGYAPPVVHQQAAGGSGKLSEVLFFPDPAMPCHYAGNCRRNNCTYAHQPTNLTRLLQFLGSARSTIDVCVFTITCDEIAEALLAAQKRGVRVRIISDNDQSKTQGSDVERLRAAGIPVALDADQYHMHHKFAVLDSRMIANGSFNWTRQAVLFNQENVVLSDNPALVAQFCRQFEILWRKYYKQ